jgi:hypothetical protein
MKTRKALLQSLINKKTTNSYTKKEREELIILSTDIKNSEDGTYLIFLFEGVRDIIIYLKCKTDEEYDFTSISIPNQKIIKKELLDKI